MRAITDKSLCRNCNYCNVAIACSGEEACIACGSCIDACPYFARKLVANGRKSSNVTCTINGQQMDVQGHQSVLQALELLDFRITSFPTKDSIFAPCRTGGCYACAVQIDGELKPTCITPIREGMVINTQVGTQIPKRIVSGFQGHHVGGVGTPFPSRQ